MPASVLTAAPASRVTFRDVFAVREFRALWLAQLLSIGGDQFARLALAVLVYDRTGSAALAAVTFAVNTVAMFAGGLGLGWIADRYPRRAVMIGCDLICLVLVLVMTIPGLPLAALVGLLFIVTLALNPFVSARMAVNMEALGPRRFALGYGITISTYQVAELAGFAAGGFVTAVAGVRGALLIDAASFAASAVLIRLGVRKRPALGGSARPGKPEIWAGARLVFARPVARTAMLLIWLAAFYAAPAGVVVPLGRSLGGGAETVGWLLAAMAAGAAAGPLLYARLLCPARQLRLAAVSAGAACAVLVLFALSPGVAWGLVLLLVSGLFTGYVATAGSALFRVIPDERRGQASGIVGAGMSLGLGAAIIAAGAAAEHVSPSVVIAGCGAIGAVLALVLAVRWRRLVAIAGLEPATLPL